jgi:hypothetical protein
MPSTSQYTPGDIHSCDPNAPDPIWDLVERYRRICHEKTVLQEEILRKLGERERERGAESEVETPRTQMALAAMRMRRYATEAAAAAADHARCSNWAWGNYVQGERPAITDLDGPREDPIRNGDLARRSAADTSNLPPHAPHARVGVTPAPAPPMPLPTLLTSITPVGLAPDVEPSRLSADGSVFVKYNKMITALRTRSPPLTLSFIPREEIPWPLLPSDGVFPVSVSRTRQIELDEVAEFAAGYALWRGGTLGKALGTLLGHWICMDKRLRETSNRTGQGALEVSTEVSETRRWIGNVRSTLFSIMAEKGT